MSSDAEQVHDGLLRDGPRLVPCSTQAGPVSARQRMRSAGPRGHFWQTLFDVALVRVALAPQHHRRLIDYGIGLADVAKKTSRLDSILRISYFDVHGFEAKMLHFQIQVIASNGKRKVYAALGIKTLSLDCGLEARAIGRSRVSVPPSTSVAARKSWSIASWRQLAQFAREAA
jgi:TDG/mug DNA glycosylase family protein